MSSIVTTTPAAPQSATPPHHTRALVLFSGGQDSTACLAYALAKFAHVETVGFDYGQRHSIELTQRITVLAELRKTFPQWGAKLGDDHVLDLAVLGSVSETSLTRDMAFKMEQSGLPNTFVPGRNLLFLTFAAALAYRRDLQVIVTGVCETDFSGYPDCRDDTMKAMQLALSLGMDKRFLIDTPLMWIDKAATWRMTYELGAAASALGDASGAQSGSTQSGSTSSSVSSTPHGGQQLVDLVVEHTHTCYLGDRTHRHAWGYGCGECPACALRKRGWEQFTALLK
jgi:7-cyano-7-deazaguanine synthase